VTTSALDPPVAVRRSRLLRPRLTVDLVPRPRLVERLNYGLDQALITVITPAGFGKTTLLCEWLAQCPFPAAWLTIADGGDDLAGFVSHFVAAVQSIAPQSGQETLGRLRLPGTPSPRVLAATLDDELLDLADELVVVLDDYQEISDPRVHEFLSALLEHPPPGLHLAIAARVDPPLPLARLRARGRLRELRAADLRFTIEETCAFFARSTDVSLDPSTAALLEQRVEGWAAGLRLAALSLPGAEAPTAIFAAFEGRRLAAVMMFLSDEVLMRQSVEVQEFLLHTSILERLCVPLCDALLGPGEATPDGARLLAQALASNLFLEPLGDADGEGPWYRYHALFRDVLADRLHARVGEVGTRALHRRARAWFASRNLVDEALHHALAAGDVDEAATLVERQIMPALNRRDRLSLERWLGRLPRAVVEMRPQLLMAEAWLAFHHNRFTRLSQVTGQVAALLDGPRPTAEPAQQRTLRAELDVLASFVLYNRGEVPAAAAAAARALEAIPDAHHWVKGVALHEWVLAEAELGHSRSVIERLEQLVAADPGLAQPITGWALMMLATVHYQEARLPESWRAARLALAAGDAAGVRPLAAGYHRLCGLIAYETNQLDQAIEHFTRITGDVTDASWTMLRSSAFGLALAHQARGRFEEAQAAVRRYAALVQDPGSAEQSTRVAPFEARLALLRGDLAAASRWLTTPTLDAGGTVIAHLDARLTRVRVELALGDDASLAAAEAALPSLLEDAGGRHLTAWLIEVLALQAMLDRLRARVGKAVATLEQAIELARPGGFIRTFVDLGPDMAELLRALRPCSPHPSYIDRILAAFPQPGAAATPTPARPAAQELLDALTDREVDVLSLLGQRLSNKEIAQTLMISPLTVKVHASNIYSKLGVGGRREAIRKARALGLFPPA
jgi:LuxR family maltose regulon positive regulatory protein